MAMMQQNQGKESPEEHLIAQHMAGMFTSKVLVSSFISSIHTFDSWVIDSGATDHICTSLSLMHSVSPLHNPIKLSLPNGHHVTVTQSGSVYINPLLTIHNVLLVPHFTYNLLSVPQLVVQTACHVIF